MSSLSTSQENTYCLPDEATLAVMQEHSFSDQVARRLLARQPGTAIRHYASIGEAYEVGMRSGQYVLLPFENSGSNPSVVWQHIDLIDSDPTVCITGEIHHNILMCVGGLAHTNLQDVRTVISHPKAIEQSSRYLGTIAGLQYEHANSTAAGLHHIGTYALQNTIGLGTREAIQAAGLSVLDDNPNITNLPGDQNITQFFVVHRNGGSVEPDYDCMRHAALLKIPKGGPGTLARSLSVMKTAGVDLTSLHSRAENPKANMQTAQNEFFIEMERKGDPAALKTMYSRMQNLGYGEMRSLGSWNDYIGPQLEPTAQLAEEQRIMLTINNRQQYHRILLEPNNNPGVLADILNAIADSEVDITDFQSLNVGAKRYGFDVVLDQSTAKSKSDFEEMLRALYYSPYLRQCRTLGSSDSLEDLRKISVSV